MSAESVHTRHNVRNTSTASAEPVAAASAKPSASKPSPTT